MFLLEAISTAKEGLVEKYKARFNLDPQSDGYIFYKDDYGTGAKCSKEQYEAYVSEFESFVAKRHRFIWWWFLTVLVMYAAVLGYLVFFPGHGEILKDNEDMMRHIALVLLMLPLLITFYKGATLYQKPSQELGTGNEIGRERHSREQIIDRRLRGAPWKIPIFGIFVSGLGLYFDVEEVSGGCDSPYMRYFFIVAIVGFLWFGIRKFKAQQRAQRE